MVSSVILPPDYRPNKKEEYMNDMQLEYFRQKLLSWKKELLVQSSDTLEELRQGGLNQPDDIDRASLETDKSIDLRTKDRARKLIVKIVPDVQAPTLTKEIRKNVKKSANIYTDEWLGYNEIHKYYNHSIVKRCEKELVNGSAYTNNIECFWGIWKRGILGIYHFTSKKLL